MSMRDLFNLKKAANSRGLTRALVRECLTAASVCLDKAWVSLGKGDRSVGLTQMYYCMGTLDEAYNLLTGLSLIDRRLTRVGGVRHHSDMSTPALIYSVRRDLMQMLQAVEDIQRRLRRYEFGTALWELTGVYESLDCAFGYLAGRTEEEDGDGQDHL